MALTPLMKAKAAHCASEVAKITADLRFSAFGPALAAEELHRAENKITRRLAEVAAGERDDTPGMGLSKLQRIARTNKTSVEDVLVFFVERAGITFDAAAEKFPQLLERVLAD